MLFRNDIFAIDGVRYRLLHVDSETSRAWAISLGDKGDSMPQPLPIHLLAALTAVSLPEIQSEQRTAPTTAMLASQQRALAIIGDLADKVPAIFEPKSRSELICAHAKKTAFSRKAIYKNLHRYWIGGQTASALLPHFRKCGVSTALTNGRGPEGKRPTYQLSERDHQVFRRAIKGYLDDIRWSVRNVYTEMLKSHYCQFDEHEKPQLLLAGERPSVRQFEHFLRKEFSLETRLRNRKGNANFNREDRAVLGSVLDDCIGVAHYYEADATVGDVLLVSESDPNLIVGKPTIYIIADRKSRLIVGFYVGFENASWTCAMQAVVSIAQDKQELCERFGVEYSPDDWPAHATFPQQMLFDRGEGYTFASNRLAENMAVTVANAPALRPDWKAIVESRFKYVRQTLQGGVYGFVVPEDAKLRRNNTGVAEREACLTLKEFTAIFLNCIIMHNRSPMKNYQYSLPELAAKNSPSPINIWNFDIANRSGLACRYSEKFVRLALLPQDSATVTRFGILFKGCYYSCHQALSQGWFVKAHKSQFSVAVSFDSRLVDTIYVHHPDKKGVVFECQLTGPSSLYRGLSLPEVMTLLEVAKRMEPDVEQAREQAKVEYRTAVETIQQRAKRRLQEAAVKRTRSSRKADIKDARAKELKEERNNLLAPTSTQAPPLAPVVPLRPAPPLELVQTQETDEAPKDTGAAASISDKARLARERMMNGQW
jgi:putative transposase